MGARRRGGGLLPILLLLLLAQRGGSAPPGAGSTPPAPDAAALAATSGLNFACVSPREGKEGLRQVVGVLMAALGRALGGDGGAPEGYPEGYSLQEASSLLLCASSYMVLEGEEGGWDWRHSEQHWAFALRGVRLLLRLNQPAARAALRMLRAEGPGRRRGSLADRVLHQTNRIFSEYLGVPYPHPLPRAVRSARYLTEGRAHWTRAEAVQHATQCNRSHTEAIQFTDDWGEPCEDFEGALRYGGRGAYNAPFVPRGACGLRWFSPGEACDIVQSLGMFLSIGDSVTRGLQIGLHMVLLGDFNYSAGLVPGPPFDCACERQFEPHCPWRTATKEPPEIAWYGRPIANDWDHGSWCPGWGREHTVHLDAGRYTSIPRRDLRFLHWGREGNKDLVLYLYYGVHNKMSDPERVLAEPWAPSVDLVRRQGFEDVVVVCGLVVACGRHKSPLFLDTQSNDVIEQYNGHVRRWCKDRGFLVFEQHSVTQDAEDLDGTHYTPWTNVHLAQLLLNQIVRWQEGGDL